jgi:hypothetical protein
MSGEGGGVSRKKEEAEQDACLEACFRVQSALFEQAWCEKHGVSMVIVAV